MSTTKERPILFSAPMVRAILDGHKMQTRRIMKWPPPVDFKGTPTLMDYEEPAYWAFDAWHIWAWYEAGDRLWVKETWRVHKSYNALRPGLIVTAMGGDTANCIDYRATPRDDDFWGKTRVSIHMPRPFSRITLEITSVRVERLNDINRGDCMAEGCPFPNMANGDDPRNWYRDLWDSINGTGSWALNPWVWVIEFRRVEK